MTKRIKAYKAYIDRIINENDPHTDWQQVLCQHRIQLGFFMHERLIHLIVTVLFALMELVTLALTVVAFSLPVMVLFFTILILLVPYIAHYYLLENSVQYMYRQYDRLLALSGQSAFSCEEE